MRDDPFSPPMGNRYMTMYLVLVQLELDHVVESELGVGRVDRLDATRLGSTYNTAQIRQGLLYSCTLV